MTPSAAAPGASAPGALGFPRGAWLIIAVEFWERFSFYGMMSLLVLFLTASPTSGGFGWSAARALTFSGGYTFAMYALPAVGGYFADQVIGRRRAVTIGALLMTVGQVMLASPSFLPQLLGWLHGVPLLAGVRALGVPFAQGIAVPEVAQALHEQGMRLDPVQGARWLGQAYGAITWGFHAAVFCLIVGNALMKSTLVVLCGETMRTDDPRREAAFAYYYMGIAIGAMLSGVVVGSTAQAFGWSCGFAMGAGGMTLALFCYLLLGRRWLGDIGVRPNARLAAADEARAGLAQAAAPRTEIGSRILLLLVLALLLCAFSIGWFQLYGSWLLFIEHDVDRTFLGHVIPVPWFTSINAALVISSAPLVAALWVHLGKRNVQIDIVQKYVFALATVAVAHLLLYLSARDAAPGAPAAPLLPLISVGLIGVGEIVAWTATYGLVSRAAPRGYASVAMGAWYLMTLGLGGYLSGFAGRLVDSLGFSGAFGALGLGLGAACCIALLLRAPLTKLAASAQVRL